MSSISSQDTATIRSPVAYDSVVLVDNCNFATTEIGLEFAGASIMVNKPLQNNALFTGRISAQRAPLKDAEYNSFFKSIGLFYYPGCQGIRLIKTIAVINTIATDFDSYPNFTCSELGG
jgi:predicted Kef-type K+ transport protein